MNCERWTGRTTRVPRSGSRTARRRMQLRGQRWSRTATGHCHHTSRASQKRRCRDLPRRALDGVSAGANACWRSWVSEGDGSRVPCRVPGGDRDQLRVSALRRCFGASRGYHAGPDADMSRHHFDSGYRRKQSRNFRSSSRYGRPRWRSVGSSMLRRPTRRSGTAGLTMRRWC